MRICCFHNLIPSLSAVPKTEFDKPMRALQTDNILSRLGTRPMLSQKLYHGIPLVLAERSPAWCRRSSQSCILLSAGSGPGFEIKSPWKIIDDIICRMTLLCSFMGSRKNFIAICPMMNTSAPLTTVRSVVMGYPFDVFGIKFIRFNLKVNG